MTFESALPPAPKTGMNAFVDTAAILIVGGRLSSVMTVNGVKPALVATVIGLTGPVAGQIVTDKRIFNNAIVRHFGGSGGKAFVVHFALDHSTGIPGLVSLDASGEEKRLADDWDRAHPGKLDELIKLTIESYEDADRPQPAQQQYRPAQAPPQRPTWNNPPQAPSAPPFGQPSDPEDIPF